MHPYIQIWSTVVKSIEVLLSTWVLDWGKNPKPETPNSFNLESEKKYNHSVLLFCNTVRIFCMVFLTFNEIHMILKPVIFVSISEIEAYSSAQQSHNDWENLFQECPHLRVWKGCNLYILFDDNTAGLQNTSLKIEANQELKKIF